MADKTESEWRSVLTPEQYRICREKGTEPAFTGEYLNHHEAGQYTCVCCGNPLFDAKTKFDSGSGWPSFWKAQSKESLVEKMDKSHGMIRQEIICASCKAHLGHVFNDGPEPTGLRYCINSVALKFKPESKV